MKTERTRLRSSTRRLSDLPCSLRTTPADREHDSGFYAVRRNVSEPVAEPLSEFRCSPAGVDQVVTSIPYIVQSRIERHRYRGASHVPASLGLPADPDQGERACRMWAASERQDERRDERPARHPSGSRRMTTSTPAAPVLLGARGPQELRAPRCSADRPGGQPGRPSSSWGRPYEVINENGGYTVKLELPFASRDEVRLSRTGDELIVHVGTWRRSLVLPRVLMNAQTKGAKMEGNTLTIRFDLPARGTARTNRGGRR